MQSERPSTRKDDGYEDPAAMKEKVKAAAAARSSEKSAGAGLLTPLVPVVGHEETFERAATADELLDNATTAAAELSAEAKVKLDKQYQCFVKCRDHGSHPKNRPSHGLYLTSYPQQGLPVKFDGWYSNQKPNLKEPYYPLQVLCQVCAHDLGRNTPLPVRKLNAQGDIQIEDRFLWRRPRDNARARIEGETRVFPQSGQSQNRGRDEALARSRAEYARTGNPAFEVVE